MATEQQLADFYVSLRGMSAPLRADFAESATAGERMAAVIAESTSKVQADMDRANAAAGGFAADMDRAAMAVTGAADRIATAMASISGAAERSATGVEGASRESMTAAEREAAAWQASADRQLAAFAEISAGVEKSNLAARRSIEATTSKMVTQSAAMGTAATRAEAANTRMAASSDRAGAAAAASSRGMSTAQKAALGVGAGAIYAAEKTVRMAADYQTATTKLVTSGGETDRAIDSVRTGMLQMSSQVGVSAQDLAKAMYKVESAGYHGASGLGLLKAAEQGAKAEGADATTVADALSSAMRDYYPHAKSAADVTKYSTDIMSKLIGATSNGKMTFDELASSLNSILPVASAAHISLSDILGALSSMTVHGISAQQATQNLADAVRHMQAPTGVMQKAMASLGVDALNVQQNLGKRGLTGTLEYLSEAVKKAMPPGSNKVILDLTSALKASTPEVRDLGNQLLTGSISMKEYTKAARNLDPISAKQAGSFSTLVGQYHQLGVHQMTGKQVMQNYGGMLQKVTGDATTLKVALMTTGENTNYTNQAVKNISKSTADAQGNVRGWAEVQGTFNQKMTQAKAGLEATAISIGQRLLPAATWIVTKIGQFTAFLQRNKGVADAVAVVIGVVLAGAIVTCTAAMIKLAARMVAKPFQLLGGAADGTALALKKLGVAGIDAEKPAMSLARTLGRNTVSAARELGRASLEVASDLGGRLASGASSAGSKIVEFGANIGGKALSGVRALGSSVVSLGARMVASLVPAIVSAVASTWAFTAALLANPITWIVVGIMALIAAIVLLVTHWRQVGNFLRGAWGGFINWAKGIWGSIAGFFTNLWHKVSGVLKTWGPVALAVLMPFVGIPLLIWQHWNQIVAFLAKVWHAVWGFLKTWGPVAIAVLVPFIGIPLLIFQHFGEIYHFFVGLWNRVKSWFIFAWEAILNWCRAKFVNALNFWYGLWNRIIAFFHGLWQRVHDGVVAGWNAVIGWIRGIPGQILSFFADTGRWLLNAGQNLLTGLWNGISNAAGWLWRQITNFCNSIIKGVENFFGISSPSKVFAQHGQYLAEGLAQGIAAHTDKAVAAAKVMAAKVTGAASGLTVGVTTAQTASGAGAMLGGVAIPAGAQSVLVINVQGNIIAERDLVQLVEREMTRLGARRPQTYANYRR